MAFVNTESLIDYTICEIIQYLNEKCVSYAWDKKTKKRVPKDCIKEVSSDEFEHETNVFFIKRDKDSIFVKYNSNTSIEIKLNWALVEHQYRLGSYKIKPWHLSNRDWFDEGSTSYFYGEYDSNKHNYCEFLNELKRDILHAINLDTDLWYRKEIALPKAFN